MIRAASLVFLALLVVAWASAAPVTSLPSDQEAIALSRAQMSRGGTRPCGEPRLELVVREVDHVWTRWLCINDIGRLTEVTVTIDAMRAVEVSSISAESEPRVGEIVIDVGDYAGGSRFDPNH
jgi:hypothetical protein